MICKNNILKSRLFLRWQKVVDESAAKLASAVNMGFEPIDITVRTLMGTEFVLEEIHPCETVRMLKMTIQDAHGLRYSNQNLMFGRTILDDDDKELHHYGVKDSGCVLSLVASMRGGPLNARRATSASSMEPETELVLELLDGADVIGAVTLDEDVFDMLPGAEGKQFYVYFPSGEEMPVDLQRLIYMDVEEYFGQYAEESAAQSPLYGEGGDPVDNASCHTPMCTSRARTRSYSSTKVRRDQEERERMEMKVEHLRARMTTIRTVKKALRDADKKQREDRAAKARVAKFPSLSTVQKDSVPAHKSTTTDGYLDARHSDRDSVPLFSERSLFNEAPTRAEGPTPLRACGGGRSRLDRLVLERSPDPVMEAMERDICSKARARMLPPLPLQPSHASVSGAMVETAIATPAAEVAPAPCHAISSRRPSVHGITSQLKKPRARSVSISSSNKHNLSQSHHTGIESGSVWQPSAVDKQLLGRASPAVTPGVRYSEGFREDLALGEGRIPVAPPPPTATQSSFSKTPQASKDLPAISRETLSRCPHVPGKKPSFGDLAALQLRPKESKKGPPPSEPASFSLPPIHPTRAGQANVSNGSISARQKTDILVAKKKEVKPRCSQCGKKLPLAGTFTCRCGLMLCTKHRYAETHTCSFDYKTEGRKELKEANPAIHALKLPKI